MKMMFQEPDLNDGSRKVQYKISLRKAMLLNRITMGLFFFVSGIANYLNFNAPKGFYHTVLTSKLQLWGRFPEWWHGIGPLPELLAVPYAYALPMAEIVFGLLFALGIWVRWTGGLIILMTFSIVLAFGIIPTGSLFPNGAESFNKNILFMTLVWMCIAYEVDAQRRRVRRTGDRIGLAGAQSEE